MRARREHIHAPHCLGYLIDLLNIQITALNNHLSFIQHSKVHDNILQSQPMPCHSSDAHNISLTTAAAAAGACNHLPVVAAGLKQIF